MPIMPHILTATYGINVSCVQVHGTVLLRISRVVYILAMAVKRVLPIYPWWVAWSRVLFSGDKNRAAQETMCGIPNTFSVHTFLLSDATPYRASFFVYTKEYKGFQLNFSPPVNKRNLNLVIGTRQGTVLNYLLAPLYSVGLIHSTKNRLITSPSVTLGVAGLVAIVKGLNPIWRCIMDAGVVVDLTWGSLSILVIFFQFRSIR